MWPHEDLEGDADPPLLAATYHGKVPNAYDGQNLELCTGTVGARRCGWERRRKGAPAAVGGRGDAGRLEGAAAALPEGSAAGLPLKSPLFNGAAEMEVSGCGRERERQLEGEEMWGYRGERRQGCHRDRRRRRDYGRERRRQGWRTARGRGAVKERGVAGLSGKRKGRFCEKARPASKYGRR